MTRLTMSDRLGSRGAAVLVVASIAVAATRTGAHAAIATDSTQFTIAAGPLTFFPAPALTDTASNPHGNVAGVTLGAFGVRDASGSGRGWNVTVQNGELATVDALTLNSSGAAFTSRTGTSGIPPALRCAGGCVLGQTPTLIATATDSAGMGTWVASGWLSSSLSLWAPAPGAFAAERRADLIWTLGTGP